MCELMVEGKTPMSVDAAGEMALVTLDDPPPSSGGFPSKRLCFFGTNPFAALLTDVLPEKYDKPTEGCFGRTQARELAVSR